MFDWLRISNIRRPTTNTIVHKSIRLEMPTYSLTTTEVQPRTYKVQRYRLLTYSMPYYTFKLKIEPLSLIKVKLCQTLGVFHCRPNTIKMWWNCCAMILRYLHKNSLTNNLSCRNNKPNIYHARPIGLRAASQSIKKGIRLQNIPRPQVSPVSTHVVLTQFSTSITLRLRARYVT